MKYYKCMHCGQIIEKVKETSVHVMCCGETMKELIPNTTDAANEKHVPVVTINGNVVDVVVGSVTHPMLPEHYIQWIAIETNLGSHIRCLNPGEEPHAVFTLAENETLIAAYEYCNLHSLWAKK